MSLTEIFSSSYLFDPTPSHEIPRLLEQASLFGVLIAASIVFLSIKKIDKKVRWRNFYCYFTTGFLGFVYLFARYESLPWLGSRLFLGLIILTLFVWTLVNTIWISRYSKKLQDKKVLEARYNKYLPKGKNKNSQN